MRARGGADVELTQLPKSSRPSLILPEPLPILELCGAGGGSAWCRHMGQFGISANRLYASCKPSRVCLGSRSIVSMMQEDSEQIGRFKVRGLMRELALVSKQPGSHAYKQATVERPDIPNILNRAFDVPAPNQVWCGDITYIWAQGKWHYLAVVMDLYARRVVGWALSNKPDANLVIKALDMAYEQRGRPQGLLFQSDSKS